MNNLMELLSMHKLLYWEVKEKRKRKITVLLKEININTLLLNFILLVTMLLVKMVLYKELKNYVNKITVKKKEFSWLLIGIDTTVVNADLLLLKLMHLLKNQNQKLKNND